MTGGFSFGVIVNPADDPFTESSLLIAPADCLELTAFLRSLLGEAAFLDMDLLRLSPVSAAERILSGRDPRDVLAAIVCDHHVPLQGPLAWASALETGSILADAGVTVIFIGKPAKAFAEGVADVRGRPHPNSFAASEADPEPLVAGIVAAAASGLRGGELRESARSVPVNLSMLPPPLFSDGDGYVEVRSMLAGRGCPRRCGFCSVPGYRGSWRGRSPEATADSIISFSRAGADRIMLLDDDALVSKARAMRLCSRLAAEGHSSVLGCLTHASCVDDRVAEALASAGFVWLHLGAESGDDRVLRRAGKGQTVRGLLSAVGAARRAGLRVRTSWILDLPGTDEAACERTLEAIVASESHEVRLHRLARRFGSAWWGGGSDEQIHGTAWAAAGPSARLAERTAERVSSALTVMGWSEVSSPSVYRDSAFLSSSPRIVSRLPIRYGIGWTARRAS
jgi:hypothetical protein